MFEKKRNTQKRKLNNTKFLGEEHFKITFLSLFLFPGLHSALLRLLATNYPHLCLVEDWVCEEEVTGTLPLLRRMMLPSNTCRYTQSQLHQGEEGGNKG